MFIGLMAGAYSSIFIAAQLWVNIRFYRKPKKQIKHKSHKKEAVDELTITYQVRPKARRAIYC